MPFPLSPLAGRGLAASRKRREVLPACDRCLRPSASCRCEKICAGAALELATGVGAERGGVARRAVPRGLEGFAAVGFGDQAMEVEPAATKRRMTSDRRAAGTIEHRQEGTLGRKLHRRFGIADRVEESAGPGIVRTRLDGDDALADRRNEFVDRKDGRRSAREAEAFQSGEREQRRIDNALVELAQARLDIAAE